MKMRSLSRWFAISLLTVCTAWGQAPESSKSPQPPAVNPQIDQHGKQPLLREFLQDEWRMWTSPLRQGTHSSHTLKKYVIPFALLSGALIATDTRTADLLPNTPNQKKWSGRVSQIGASYSQVGLSGGIYLLGKATANRHTEETGLLALHAIAHTQIITQVVKQLTNRERPLTHDDISAGFWSGGDSFPSGHASTTFAVATVFAYEYRQHLAVPIVAYGVASAVAASRLSAQRHWVSDIVVGGSTGFLIGRYVYKRHHDPSLPGSPVSLTNRFVPQVSVSTTTLSLDWQF